MTVLVVMIVVVMLVIVATTVAIFIVMMVMMLVIVIVMMLVIVASAVAIFIVMMVMLMLMVLMIVATAVAIFIVVMVMVMMLVFVLVLVLVMMVVLVIVVVMTANGTRILFHKLLDMLLKCGSLFKSRDESAYLKFISGGGDNYRSCILFSYESECFRKLCIGGLIGVAEKHTACICDLIAEEFTKVLHIHLALVDVNDGNRAIELSTLYICLKNCFSNVRELSYARGLDKDPVGRILVHDLLKCLAEISNERAADTARIHLGYFNPRILEEAAVNAYLAEFVFDKNDFLALIRFVDKTVDKSSLTSTEKS